MSSLSSNEGNANESLAKASKDKKRHGGESTEMEDDDGRRLGRARRDTEDVFVMTGDLGAWMGLKAKDEAEEDEFI